MWTLVRLAALAAVLQIAQAQDPEDRDRLADLLQQTLLAEEQLASWGRLHHGSLAVGFEVRADVSYWYPAASGPAMILADYADPAQFEAGGPDVGELLEARMYASRGAPALSGPYPLIIVPGGYPNPSLFAETAEFLASHGFVVAYFASPDAPPAETLAHATAMLARVAHPAADPARVALWGYQRSGGVALLLQDQVDAAAIVSVEGSEAWRDETHGLPALRPQLARVQGSAPVLRFQSNGEEPPEHRAAPANTTLEFYDAYPGCFEQVEFDRVSHDQLSARAVWARLAPGLIEPSDGAVEAHQRIAERSLAFIKSHTQH